MKVSNRRGSLVCATGSGTVTDTDERSRLTIAVVDASLASDSSRTTRASVVSLRSCCDTARSRSSLSNGDACPTSVVETPEAVTAIVAPDRYTFGKYLTSTKPTTIDARMGTTSHHLRRRKTER